MRREVNLIIHIYLLPGLNPRAAIISPEPTQVAAILLGLWVRIPPAAWMSVSSRQDLCVGLTTRPEGSYRVWRVWVWSRSLAMEGHERESGGSATGGKNIYTASYVWSAYEKLQCVRKENIHRGVVWKRSSLRACTRKKRESKRRWTKLHNPQIPFLSPSIITMTTAKHVRHAPLMWKVVSAHKNFRPKMLQEENIWERKIYRYDNSAKMDLKELGFVGSEFSWFREQYGGRLFWKFVFDKRRGNHLTSW